jgi:hypothetical protein
MTQPASRRPLLFAIGAIVAASLAMTTAGHAYDLDQHAWRDRLLIIAAPAANDGAVTQQLEAIAQRSDAIRDRRLKVIELYADRGAIDGHPLPDEAVAELRGHFDVAADARALILIGLDGRVKRRAALGSELREMFLEIDAMPMRQSEIRAKKAAGEPVTTP